MLAAMMANMMLDKNDKAKTVADFVPADMPIIDPTAESWDNLRKLSRTKKYGQH